uniref:Uncharacterized protein n=1 Tax=Mimivirus LCMiAC02 TaxID=2506609 RepID=A0A4D5XF03_9VIRU|nr:MAG: hypothetical protein LCMiAC02_04150 [Mimivirus LCMiAC02]
MYNKKHIEKYDDVYQISNIYKCLDLCKTSENCYGVGFDNDTNDSLNIISPSNRDNNSVVTGPCYLSSSPIFGSPLNADYEDKYRSDHIICNKVIPIISADNNLSVPEKKGNAIFSCRKKKMQPQLYYHNKNKLIKIDAGQNFDFLTSVSHYNIKPYKWFDTIRETSLFDRNIMGTSLRGHAINSIARNKYQ